MLIDSGLWRKSDVGVPFSCVADVRLFYCLLADQYGRNDYFNTYRKQNARISEKAPLALKGNHSCRG